MYALIGILLIVAGVLAILFMPDSKKASTNDVTDSADSVKSTAAGSEKSEEEQQKEAEAAAQNRAQCLSALVIPGNMPPIRIYFGSQTGTAEKFANVLDEEASALGVEDCKVIDFNSFKEEEFGKQPLVLMCVATHYEGDPCDNTRNFLKYLKKILKNKTEKAFTGMSFSIFGLGDTSYEQYNEMGKVFDESFEKLGGNRLHEMGVGNAETFSTEDDFNKWKEDLWKNIIEHYVKTENPVQKKQALLRKRSSMMAMSDPTVLPWTVDTSGLLLQDNAEMTPEYDMNMRNYLASKPLKIRSIRELRQECVDGGSTIEVVYDLRGTGLTYKTAANSAIYAQNKPEDVEKFAQMFELTDKLDMKFCFTKNPEFKGKLTKTPFPVVNGGTADGMSIREALMKHIDLTSQVSKKVLSAMIHLCEAQEDKALLEEVVKNKSTKYDEIFMQRNLGLLDILSVVPSLRLTPNFIFQKCDLIKPRYYTIASSSLAYPEDLTISISLSRFEVTLPDSGEKIMRDGLVSGYLEQIYKRHVAAGGEGEITDTTLCFVKDSNFVMPVTHDVPMIMVGPGTGVVPFIGFMQEREKARTDSGSELGAAHLYFGCRQHNTDFIYRDEMHSMKDKGVITSVNSAFSRPQEPGAVKAYVQDLLSQNRELIKQTLVEQNGQFFICGATTMGRAVETLLKETLGEEVFKNIQKEKRYKVELWSA